MFITFEGGEFVGKTTQSKILAEKLREQGHKVVSTFEPGGTPFGMRVREIIKSEPDISLKSQFHLIEAQRAHHVQEVILPSIVEGKIVICDRFIDTSYVYQNGYMSDWEWQEYLEEYPIVPDLTFFLWSANLSTIRQDRNRENTVNDHFDNVSVDELARKQNLFFRLAAFANRIVAINTDRTVDEVAALIWNFYQSWSGDNNEGSIRP